MTTVADILDVLEALAPTGMKMDWDNVGLLCGSRSAPCGMRWRMQCISGKAG